jgi:hypothetical protein
MPDIDTIPRAVAAEDSDRMMRIMFFPDPGPLEKWLGADSFETIFFVRILDCNPKSFNIQVKRLDLPAPIKQGDLGQTHIDEAPDAPHLPGGTGGYDLNLKINTSEDALVIFEMFDKQAEFLVVKTGAHEFANGVVKAVGDPDLIYQAEWVPGFENSHTAVSVILQGVPKGGPGIMQQYGLGVRMRNSGNGYTDVNIDPKIENDGDD